MNYRRATVRLRRNGRLYSQRWCGRGIAQEGCLA